MIMNPLCLEATQYVKLRQEAQEGSMNAQRTLDAINKTLDHFNVRKDRPIAAENLLKFYKLPRNRWDTTDRRVGSLVAMAEYLEEI